MHLLRCGKVVASAFLLAAALVQTAPALEHVTFNRDGRRTEVAGKLLVEAQDGGVLVLGRDGLLWAVQPDELAARSRDDVPFKPLSPEELAGQVLGRLPDGFQVHRTANYLILHNASDAYAQWCGALFERLYGAFENFWTRKGFDLAEPELPLVAIVFADKRSYVDYARAEVGDAVEQINGHYNLQTNWMVMFDPTGGRVPAVGNARAQITLMLSRPEAAQIVSTVIHEATHQIAYNTGMNRRWADTPMWLSEGIAMYFETPDLRSRQGWRTIGAVNHSRLGQFKAYLRTRPADSLGTLVGDDQRFRSTETAGDAYGEAWALTYYLLRRYPDKYVKYLEIIAAKDRPTWDSADRRLAEFREAFGDDLDTLDRDFVRNMARLR